MLEVGVPKTLEQLNLERQELDRREMMRESYRRERICLAAQLADAYRTLGGQVGTLSDTERDALIASIKDLKIRIQDLDRQQSPAYSAGNLTPCPFSERVR